MVEKLISFSLKNRIVVLLVSAVLFGWGIYSVQQNPIDAIPDLSENQVIVLQNGWEEAAGHRRSSNLSTGFQLTGNPKNQKHSCFIDVWDEFCLHHFEDNVDPYWARTRVLERLNYAQRLPLV
jgi:Cu(I)/Ag(I) efflux system membrane protein CusA/SilA